MNTQQIEAKFFNKTSIPDNRSTRSVFSLLTTPENVAAMICLTKLGLPALTPVVFEIERIYVNDPLFPMLKAKNRQNVGRMVKFIMSEFGYKVKESGLGARVGLREFARAKHFKTSAIYEKDVNPPSSNLVISIQ